MYLCAIIKYKASLSNWKMQQKKQEKLVKKKAVEQKVKAINTGEGATIRVNDLQVLLKWKLPDDEYKHLSVSSMKRQELVSTWEHYKNMEVPDIEVPPEAPKPDVPSIQETELG